MARGIRAWTGIAPFSRIKGTRRSQQTAPTIPRFRSPTIRTKGPRYLQALLRTPNETDHIPRPEAYIGKPYAQGPSFQAILRSQNEAEWRIFWALLTFDLLPDVDFQYQANILGGRQRAGGAVNDFILGAFNLVLQVQGVYFHYSSTEQSGKDLIVAAQIASYGLQVIPIDEDDAMNRPRGVVAAALRGEDVSRRARGGA